MKLKLNNLVYDTDNPVRIERLKNMGAIPLTTETFVEELEEILDEGNKRLDEMEENNLGDLKKAELAELLEEKGIEFKANTTKEEMVALLSELDEEEMDSEEE